jgi:hypothetical protein
MGGSSDTSQSQSSNSFTSGTSATNKTYNAESLRLMQALAGNSTDAAGSAYSGLLGQISNAGQQSPYLQQQIDANNAKSAQELQAQLGQVRTSGYAGGRNLDKQQQANAITSNMAARDVGNTQLLAQDYTNRQNAAAQAASTLLSGNSNLLQLLQGSSTSGVQSGNQSGTGSSSSSSFGFGF